MGRVVEHQSARSCYINHLGVLSLDSCIPWIEKRNPCMCGPFGLILCLMKSNKKLPPIYSLRVFGGSAAGAQAKRLKPVRLVICVWLPTEVWIGWLAHWLNLLLVTQLRILPCLIIGGIRNNEPDSAWFITIRSEPCGNLTEGVRGQAAIRGTPNGPMNPYPAPTPQNCWPSGRQGV